MRLSKRLQAVADLVQGTDCLADVGTDHGWIPIYLVKQGQCQRAIAMDVRPGPLMRAKEHIMQHRLEHLIDVRLSDGVSALAKGEARSLVIAGMGGNLTIHILEQGKEIVSSMQECILQPQSEIQKVRSFLRWQGWRIVDENMILEGGKFYPMMRVKTRLEKPQEVSTEQAQDFYAAQSQINVNYSQELQREQTQQEQTQVLDRFGPLLLEQRNPVLYQLLQKERKKTEQLLMHLSENKIRNAKRIQELEWEQQLISKAFQYFDLI